MLKIGRSRDRLIFNMGIPIPGKDGLYIETGPCWATFQCKGHLSRYRNSLIFIMWIPTAEKYILHIERPLRYPNRVAISTQVNTREMLNVEIPSATKISKHAQGWDCETVRTVKQSMSSWLLCIYSRGLCIYSGGKTWQNEILTFD